MRIEPGHAKAFAVFGFQTHQRSRRYRLGLLVHLHFVGIYPRMALTDALGPTGENGNNGKVHD